MADGALTIEITGPLADDVRAAAEARGMTPEEYVRKQIAIDIALDGESMVIDADLAEDEAALAEYEATGLGIPADEVIDWLQSLTTDQPLPRPQIRSVK